MRKEESGDDPKRKFLFQRQITAFVEDNPPLPLLPKSVIKRCESPRSGGTCNFLKLTRFLGRDHGRSKFKEKAETVEKVSFNHNTTLKSVFQLIPVEMPLKQSLALATPSNQPSNVPARKKRDGLPETVDQRIASATKEKKTATITKKDNKAAPSE